MKIKEKTMDILETEFGAIAIIKHGLTETGLSKILQNDLVGFDKDMADKAAPILLSGKEFNGLWINFNIPLLMVDQWKQ